MGVSTSKMKRLLHSKMACWGRRESNLSLGGSISIVEEPGKYHLH